MSSQLIGYLTDIVVQDKIIYMDEHPHMMKVTTTIKRKSDHIQINLQNDVASGYTSGFERYHFIHNALPEIDLKDVDTSTRFLSKKLQIPLIISSMTGGTEESHRINLSLARAAAQYGLAMGVGSMRAAIDNPAAMQSFRVRDVAPDILLFANLGAVQLNYGYALEQCTRAVESINADGLILHLNPLHEALQPEGETNFSNLLSKIETICNSLKKPVIVKEVGWGISEDVAKMLLNAGVSVIDVAGAGGTSWSQVEMYRSESESMERIARGFRSWGIPTSESIQVVRKISPDIPVIASGGLISGIDLAKSLVLGADIGGIAGPFLRAAAKSEQELDELIEEIRKQLMITMFAVGASSIEALKTKTLIHN